MPDVRRAQGYGRVAVLGGVYSNHLALATVLLAAYPVISALDRQQQFYESVNAHDLVFTTVLLELGPSAASDLGLPPEAVALTGNEIGRAHV